MQVVKEIDTGFSTADAENPELSFVDDKLTLNFLDWKEQTVQVVFSDVLSYKWQQSEQLLENERDDSSYEILNSEWLLVHHEQSLLGKYDKYHHFKFNFNSIGQLEVIAQCFSTKI